MQVKAVKIVVLADPIHIHKLVAAGKTTVTFILLSI